MRSETTARAVTTRRDARSFLVRTIERAIERGRWFQDDAAAFSNAMIGDPIKHERSGLVFRYLTRMRWDPRDASNIRRATAIVTAFVSDGLEQRSGGDVDRAVGALIGESLADCFRMSWRTTDALRTAAIRSLDRAMVRWGPGGEWSQRLDQQIEAILERNGWTHDAIAGGVAARVTDEALADRFRAGHSLATARAELKRVCVAVAQQRKGFDALPIHEIWTAWDRIAAVGEQGGIEDPYVIAWTGAIARALIRNDLGTVIRLDELRTFLRDHVVLFTTRNNGRAFAIAPTSRDRAIERLAVLLPQIPRAVITDAVETCASSFSARASGLEDVDEFRREANQPINRRTAAWLRLWAAYFAIVLTDAEHAELLAAEHITRLSRAELLQRFGKHDLREERLRILDALDVPSVPMSTIIDLLTIASDLASEIVSRVDWARRTPEELAMLLVVADDVRATGTITEAIVMRRPHLRDCSPELIVELCENAYYEGFDVSFAQLLLERWGVTPTAFTKAFRESEPERREWFLLLAVASPPHFADLVFEVRTFPDCFGLIEQVLAGRKVRKQESEEESVALDPAAVGRCFAWIEDRARRRKRKPVRANAKEPPVCTDADLQVLWPHLTPTYRTAVTNAIAELPKPPEPALHTEKRREVRRRKV